MLSIAADTIGGFNRMLADQKAQPGEASFSLVQFDHEYQVVYTAVPIRQVEPLTEKTFEPRGSTALLDAIARTVDATGARLAAMPEGERPQKVICVIVTDGQENASKEFSRRQVFEKISHQRDVYQWEFLFLGANQDAISEAGAIGVPATHAMNYAASAAGVASSYDSVSRATSRARSGGSMAVDEKDREGAVQH